MSDPEIYKKSQNIIYCSNKWSCSQCRINVIFFNVSGINVPNNAAKIVTVNKDILTAVLRFVLYPNVNAAINIMTEQIIPFTKATTNSFNNFVLHFPILSDYLLILELL